MVGYDEHGKQAEDQLPQIVMHLLQGNQTEEEMKTFLTWYHRADVNKTLFFQLKHLYDSRKGGLMPETDEIILCWDRLWKELISSSNPSYKVRKRRSRRFLPRMGRYAAVAAVSLAFIITVTFLISDYSSQQIVWNEIRTEAGATPHTIQLSDGSIVQLNASSSLRYPETFRGKKREVHLEGEAFFDIHTDKRRSFTVHTHNQSIQVLGTRFNVLAYAADDYSVTTLVSGKILLELFDTDHEQRKSLEMQPDQQFVWNKRSGEIRLSTVDSHDAISWLDGVYPFRDSPLLEITTRLERIYGITILIPDSSYRREQYNGKFFSGQSIEEIMDILNFKDEFQTHHQNDTIILHTRK